MPKGAPYFDFENCRHCGKPVSEESAKLFARRIENAIHPECIAGERLKRYACCDKAKERQCNCHFSTECPDHGVRCHGSHN